MLPLDNMVTAGLIARTLRDPRVRHFHDPARRAGRAVAQSLGAQGKVAWDIYLFYPGGDEWGDGLPTPTRWAHQLQADWADPAFRHRGEDLVQVLHRAMNELTAGPKQNGAQACRVDASRRAIM